MKPASLTLTVPQGSDTRYTLTLKNSEGEFIDLTGSTFRGKAKPGYCDHSSVVNISFEIPDQSSSANFGIVNMLVPKEQTTGLDICETAYFRYDVEWVKPNGEVNRIIQGGMNITPEVTK